MDVSKEVKTGDISVDKLLLVSSSPHIRTEMNITRIMLDVVIALTPAMIASVIYFGYKALILIAVSVGFAVASEYVFQKIAKRDITAFDFSAVVAGILLAFNVPVTLPPWMIAIASIFMIVVVKQLFGGLGGNFMNPALAARALLLASWPTEMSNYVNPYDMTAAATPLKANEYVSLMDSFLGQMPGCLGEVSKIALLLGVAYLLIRGVISLRIPIAFIGTAAILLFAFGNNINQVLLQVLSGGMILGAFYMATDYVSIPVNKKAQVIFGIGCGLFTALIRTFGNMPEGVCYAILFMNVATPLIEKLTLPGVFGGVKK